MGNSLTPLVPFQVERACATNPLDGLIADAGGRGRQLTLHWCVGKFICIITSLPASASSTRCGQCISINSNNCPKKSTFLVSMRAARPYNRCCSTTRWPSPQCADVRPRYSRQKSGTNFWGVDRSVNPLSLPLGNSPSRRRPEVVASHDSHPSEPHLFFCHLAAVLTVIATSQRTAQGRL